MKKRRKPLLVLLIIGALSALGVALVWGSNVAVLNPKGSIAREQFDLLLFTAALSLVIVLPVFALTFYIAWKYREGNKKAKYHPDWDRSRWLEGVWWGIPLLLITVLAVITWTSTHRLDPFRPLDSDKKPLTIQVIALEWKWLFIYPEQDIATVNHIQFPVDRPVTFQITADAPMNSFWIPQLGGQIYAMAGMETKLHLLADTAGTYTGVSANLSGAGFADMKFTAKATSQNDFDAWIGSVKTSSKYLDRDSYDALAEPTKKHPVAYYSSRDADLYATVMMQYMEPGMRKHREVRHGEHH